MWRQTKAAKSKKTVLWVVVESVVRDAARPLPCQKHTRFKITDPSVSVVSGALFYFRAFHPAFGYSAKLREQNLGTLMAVKTKSSHFSKYVLTRILEGLFIHTYEKFLVL